MSGYHKLSVAEKQRRNRGLVRAGPTRCPVCEAAVQPRDLLAHVDERCPGRPEPHPTDDWVTWAQARALGASKASLHRWARQGRVRTAGKQRERRYLLRDLAKCLAARRLGSESGTSGQP